MDAALISSAALLGLAGIPHCAAMCSAPCAAAVGEGSARTVLAFQVARVLSYALAGAVVASGMAALAALSQTVAVLRPLWTLLHVAALALGLYLLWQGQQPAWMTRGALQSKAQPLIWVAAGGGGRAGSAGRVPARGAVAGGLWALWPCGLLQSALLLAALTTGPVAGAAAMAVFALASSAALWWVPWWWRRGRSAAGGVSAKSSAATRQKAWVRLGGLMLALASSWALGHGLWLRVAAWCGLA